MMKRKPIIGIIAKYNEDTQDRQEALIRHEVKNAVIYNGGIPIGILPTETNLTFKPDDGKDSWPEILTDEQKADLITQIKLCDGIILPGGKSTLKYESWVAKYCFDNDIPTLGICGGQNAAVRGVGGTTKRVNNPEKHHQKWADEVHDLFIKKGTKFHDIVKCDKMRVNSRHKRTIDNPTDNYIVSAVCDDGYYDVIEAPNKKFNIALRFHPESLYLTHKEHNEIFKAFINACMN